MTKNLIFDFDGTICDSYDVFKESFLEVCKKYKLNASVFDLENVRELSSEEILKKLNVSWWKLPFILKDGRTEMFKRRNELRIFPGVEKILPQLAKDFNLFIVTSNSHQIVTEVLNDQAKYFKEIHAGRGLTNKSKSIKKIKKNYPAHENYYIGDEVRDVRCAHRSSVMAIAVTWGYNSIHRLQALENVALINNPAELCTNFKNIKKS